MTQTPQVKSPNGCRRWQARLGGHLLLAVLAFPALADVITVGPSGAYQEIQPAIDAASDGDEIVVSDRSFATSVESGALSPTCNSLPMRVTALPFMVTRPSRSLILGSSNAFKVSLSVGIHTFFDFFHIFQNRVVIVVGIPETCR